MDTRTAKGGRVLPMQNSLQDQGVNFLLTFENSSSEEQCVYGYPL